MAFRIQVRRDSAANWAAANPVLLAGELGAELDTGKWKIGDGVTAWNSLVYGYGATGKKIEFNWDGTQLGIREEGDTTYTYVDLVGAKGDKGDPGEAGGATTVTYTGTLASASWTGSSAPYSQTITVTGMASTDEPIYDLTLSGTYATDVTLETEWAKVFDLDTGTNQVTVKAHAIPAVDLPFRMKVVR